MDEADNAQRQIDQALAHSLSHRKPTLKPCNSCFYCAEIIKDNSLFCSPDCASDWENEQRIRSIIGRTQGHA